MLWVCFETKIRYLPIIIKNQTLERGKMWVIGQYLQSGSLSSCSFRFAFFLRKHQNKHSCFAMCYAWLHFWGRKCTFSYNALYLFLAQCTNFLHFLDKQSSFETVESEPTFWMSKAGQSFIFISVLQFF